VRDWSRSGTGHRDWSVHHRETCIGI